MVLNITISSSLVCNHRITTLSSIKHIFLKVLYSTFVKCPHVCYEWEFTTMAKAVLNHFLCFSEVKMSEAPKSGGKYFLIGGPWGQKG